MTAHADESSRLVLPADAPYLANLAALWSAAPSLAAAIEALPALPAYSVEPSKTGAPTVAVLTADQRRIYLHSRYDPADEAKRLIDTIDVPGNLVFYVFGFGLGYHVQTLFERAGDESLLFVFEPDLLLLRTAFEQLDLSRLLQSRRVQFLTEPNKGDLLTRLTPHTALIHVGAQTVIHAPSQQAAESFHNQMRGWLDEFASFGRTSLNTLLLNSKRTAENVTRNIGWYAAAPGVQRLAGRHAGEPAIIVSAGPSLRKNKHLLPGLKGRAVLIAVQTTLQPLLEMGVEPDYATSLDYSNLSTRFWEKLPPALKTELVAEPKAASAIFNLNPGPLTLLGNDFAEGLLKDMRPAKPPLRAGSTVAHLAYYLAEHMGCNPIIFVGQDLGFSDGLYYTPGTSYEDVWRPEMSRFNTIEMKQWEQIVRERFILRRIPDHEGRPMYTEERLFTYLQQFERDFMSTPTKIIDATEGGAAKRGAIAMKLADAAEQYCAKPLRPLPADYPGLHWGRLADCVDCLRRRRSEATEIERIIRRTLPLLQEVHDHLDDQPRVNRAITAIDGLRGRMNELGACYDLVTQLTQNSELRRFESDRKIAASRADGTQRQRLQVERDIASVRGVLEAAEEFQRLMDEVIEQLEADPAMTRSAAA